MNHALDIGDLSLLVRALHKDVSDLDDRLTRLEAIVRELRAAMGPIEHRDRELVVIRDVGAARGA